MPGASPTSNNQRDWQADYRQLVTELDRCERDYGGRERWFYKTVLKLVARYQNSSAEIDEKLTRVREVFRAEDDPARRHALFSRIVDECLQLSEAQESRGDQVSAGPDPAALAELVLGLRVPASREFEARQLAERLVAGEQHGQALGHLKEFIDECITQAAAGATDTPAQPLAHPVLVQLLDWLLLPGEFEQRADTLKTSLVAAANDDPVRDTASLLNDFHAFLRHDVRDLEGYLKIASSAISGIQADMHKALDNFASAQSETTEFGRRMTADVDEIHAVFDTPADRGSLKAAIESRLKAMRGALKDFLDHERERREQNVSRSQTLSAKMQQLETETNELRARLEASQAEARVDTLTGVPNRLALEDQLYKEYERARRHGHTLSYALLDLDHFKRINDTHGHAAGDKVLQQVATLCSKNLRTNDFFARYGGEEFVILLPDTEAAGAVTVASKLREAIARVRFHRSGRPVEVTLSIGVAQLRQGDSMEALFERADKALYQAKRTGRDRVVAASD